MPPLSHNRTLSKKKSAKAGECGGPENESHLIFPIKPLPSPPHPLAQDATGDVFQVGHTGQNEQTHWLREQHFEKKPKAKKRVERSLDGSVPNG